MNASKLTLDDVLRFVEETNGGHVTAKVTLTRVTITTAFGDEDDVCIVDCHRDKGDDPAIVAASVVQASNATNYLNAREKAFRDAEAASVRASAELTDAYALVASLRAAVEASK